MTIHDALLKAVLASPDDDLPRLVFADHLEENGEVERAALIRLLCHNRPGPYTFPPGSSARFGPNYPHASAVELWPGIDGVSFTADRGFITEVRCPLAGWIAHGPEIVRTQPVVKVVLTDREPWTIGGPQWGWVLPTDEVSPFGDSRGSQIPGDVFAFMRDGNYAQKLHPTREDAISALSNALISWAKSEVPAPA